MKKINIIATALHYWDISPTADIMLINYAQNKMYLIDNKYILRLCDIGYHNVDELNSELAWISALRDNYHLITPTAIRGVNGDYIQQINDDGQLYNLILFHYIDAQHINDDDIVQYFFSLGKMAATTHQHSQSWQRPANFIRPSWHEDNLFGKNGLWGNWRNAPNLTAENKAILERAEIILRLNLKKYGKTLNNYGLIHADMRLANILITHNNDMALIDFDDCGDGWFMYDFAAAVSFMEMRDDLNILKQQWLKGYATIRALSHDDIKALDDMMMARRLALLAWVAHHIEASEPQRLVPYFAHESALLAKRYISTKS